MYAEHWGKRAWAPPWEVSPYSCLLEYATVFPTKNEF